MKKLQFLYTFIIVVLLSSCQVQKWEAQSTLIPLNENTESLKSKEMVSLIAPYRNKLDKQLDAVIGYADETLDAHAPESLLSNFAADAIFQLANENIKVDIALVNLGGLRKSISKGIITYRTIYEVMPFENELVILTLKGIDVNNLLQEIAKKGGEGISGVKMGISNGEATNIFIGGVPIDSTKIYRIATSDYLSGGNDGMTSLRNAQKKETTYLKIRDLLIKYIQLETKKGKSIRSTLDQRIYVN